MSAVSLARRPQDQQVCPGDQYPDPRHVVEVQPLVQHDPGEDDRHHRAQYLQAHGHVHRYLGRALVVQVHAQGGAHHPEQDQQPEGVATDVAQLAEGTGEGTHASGDRQATQEAPQCYR